jgi:hypothetical protein
LDGEAASINPGFTIQSQLLSQSFPNSGLLGFETYFIKAQTTWNIPGGLGFSFASPPLRGIS